MNFSASKSITVIEQRLGFSATPDPSGLDGRYLMFIDLALMCCSAAVAHRLLVFAKSMGICSAVSPLSAEYCGTLFLFSILFVLFAHANGLNHVCKRTLRNELGALAHSWLSAMIVLSTVAFLNTLHADSVLELTTTALLSFLGLAGWRRFLQRQEIPGLTENRNVLIVGGGRMAVTLQALLQKCTELGYVVKGFVDPRRVDRPPNPECEDLPPTFLGKVADIPRIIREQFIDEIFICVPSDGALVREVACYTHQFRIRLRAVPDFYDRLPLGASLEYVGQIPTLTLEQSAIPITGLIFKRILDISAASLGLLLLSPILLLVYVLVRLDSQGPAFYTSLRVGRKGETFRCHKFRTMVANADDIKDSLRHLNQRTGVTFKIDSDPRITRIGRFLRKYSLDELPQLWDVLCGNVSLVGPRPHPLDDYARYALEHRRRLEVKPGITGLWQITARRDPSFEKNVALDTEYIEKWNLWLDVKILWKTLAVVVSGTGQ